MHQKNVNITVGLFYQYVFEGIKSDPKMTDEKKILMHQSIKETFQPLTNNSSPLSMTFRSTLRKLQANSLEDVLYGNHSDTIAQSSDTHFPDDQIIQAKFIELNNRYHYFPDKDEEIAAKQFVILFRGCKLVADFIEKNNDKNNDLAYLHAYKIAVFWGLANKGANPFSGIQNYIKQHAPNSVTPIHDALVVGIPINDPPLADMVGWRKLINKYGHNAIEIFQLAPKLEEINHKKSPVNLEEARKLASQLTYARYQEYPELASICNHYKVPERIYNRCLKIEQKRKSKDNLPDLIVDGKEVGHAGYYLVKLPIDDPRAYVLGHITNCCQSIGGHSQACVIDGITRKNNGFYVLLKGNPKHPHTINGKINYDHFQIVGQAYAWISLNGNLVLDSWENLRKEDDPVIEAILPKFGKAVIENSTSILRVVIGQGGRTPRAFKISTLSNPEKMEEGFQYQDSFTQSLISFDQKKLDTIKQNLSVLWDKLKHKPFNKTKKQFFKFIELDNLFSVKHAEKISRLFSQDHTHEFWKKFKEFDITNLRLMVVLDLMSQSNLLTHGNYKVLVSINYSKRSFVSVLKILNNAKLLTDENFKAYVSRGKYAAHITAGLKILQNAKLLTDENVKVLISSLYNAENTARVLVKLDLAKLFTNEFYKVFLSNPEHTVLIAKSLLRLNRAELLTDEIRKTILLNPEYANYLAESLLILNAANLLTDENLKEILSNSSYSSSIASGLLCLNDAGLLDENRKAFLSNPKNTYWISNALESLKHANLLTNKTCKTLLSSPEYICSSFVDALKRLSYADLLTHETWIVLLSIPHNASFVARALIELKYANVLTDGTREAVFSNSQYAGSMVYSLNRLRHANLLTVKNFNVLLSNPQDYSKIVDVLMFLNDTQLLTDENRDALRLMPKENGSIGSILKAFTMLQSEKLLTDKHCKVLFLANSKKVKIVDFLITLKKRNILKDEQYEKLVSYPKEAASILNCLVKSNSTDMYRSLPYVGLCFFKTKDLGDCIRDQIKNIEEDGGLRYEHTASPGSWEYNTSRYPHKWIVLRLLLSYLDNELDFNSLNLALKVFDKYDVGFSFRSDTGKLVDLAIESKSKTDIPMII